MSPTTRKAVAIAVAIVVVLGSCSDAHTEEEKAWSDDGIDPRATYVLAPRRLQNLVAVLVQSYQESNVFNGQFLVSTVSDLESEERLKDTSGDAIWIGQPESYGNLAPSETTTLGVEPLAVAGMPDEITELPPLDDAAGLGDDVSGQCLSFTPCGDATDLLFADAGIDASPAYQAGPDKLLDTVFSGDLDLAVVPRTYGVSRFPAIATYEIPLPESWGGFPYVASSFGSGTTADAFVAWVEKGLPLLAPEIELRSGIIQPTEP